MATPDEEAEMMERMYDEELEMMAEMQAMEAQQAAGTCRGTPHSSFG